MTELLPPFKNTELWRLKLNSILSGIDTIGETTQLPLLNYIPEAEWPAIFDRTSTYAIDEAWAAAVADLTAAGGGVLRLPRGAMVADATLEYAPNIIVEGAGRIATTITTDHSGDGITLTSPINSSTAVNVALRDFSIINTNGSNTGGGFVDVGGTYGEMTQVGVTGFKYGIIFDQSELWDVRLCNLALQLTAAAWLVNGSDHTPGAAINYTNRISIAETQINQNPGVHGILDDGGYAHVFRAINFNGCETQLRVAGVNGCILDGSEMEASANTTIIFEFRTFNTNTSVGSNFAVQVQGNVIVPANGENAINFVSMRDVTINNNLFGTNSAAKMVCGSVTTMFLGPNADFGGAGALFSGAPTNLFDMGMTNASALTVPSLKTAGKVLTTAGLGVGNSAAASTPGTVTKKVEIFDTAGASIGFVPVYDAIT